MENWQEEHLQVLLTIKCEKTLFKELTKIARNLGFDYCAYGLRTPLPVSRPKILMLNNYPTEWQLLYHEKNYLSIDPTVHHGMCSLLPIIWSDDVFTGARKLWEEARSFGLHTGWAQSCRDIHGVNGMLTLARSGEPISKKEYCSKISELMWLTQFAHLGITQCLTAKLLPETETRLTDREISVLRWSADGKTSGEISAILAISERTVNFHINNAMNKLGAVNKLAATVKAATLGLLY